MEDAKVHDKSVPERPSQDSPSERATKYDNFAGKPSAPPKSSSLQRLWDKLGMNVGILLTMIKGGLPPAIALALYQDTGFAAVYSTLGYLVAIMSVLSFCILPRSKFIQTMLLNIVALCIGSAVALLQIYCGTQARAHTTPTPPSSSNGPSPGARVVGYNSSASAVSAIWLFFNIYLVNTFRAARPQLQFPVIVYSVFSNVASTYAPSFPTMAAGIAFVKRLMEAFLTGFGIATGVSLFIFPVTVRMMFLKQSAGFIKAIQGTLKAQISYLQSLERGDVFTLPHVVDGEGPEGGQPNRKQSEATKPVSGLETARMKAATRALGELFGKMHADLPFAKREIAWGKLNSSDLEQFFKLLQHIMMPLIGMSSTADIFQRIAQRWRWADDPSDETMIPNKGRSGSAKRQWNDVMKTLHEPFEAVTDAMNDGLKHALYQLKLVERPKAKRAAGGSNTQQDSSRDLEAEAGILSPGDPEYARFLELKVNGFHERRKEIIATLCRQRGIDTSVDAIKHLAKEVKTFDLENTDLPADVEEQQRAQRQLFLVLYMDFLLWSIGKAVLGLVHFAESKVDDGTMKRSRLIVPGNRRIKKWILGLLNVEDSTTEHTPDSSEGGSAGIYSGTSFGAAKDPEHLPPANAWERASDGFRMIAKTLGSPESNFGFRVACATMSIAIIAYLERTRTFFLEQRIVWAMIMVAIGMTVTAGSGVFGFIGRIAGTFIAMCTSFIIWYIVNGHPPGVIVFMWLFLFIEFYFVLKYPRFIVIMILTMVTQVLIIGYELEVKKVGQKLKVATSNGQPYYPIYELAPYRLACVSGGMVVAFFWTFFPYPITARSQLRKDLGVSLYLLANFYSIVHTTVGTRIKGCEGDLSSKDSPGHKLEKARRAVFVKEMTLLAGLRQHSAFTAWEPTFGGKFPRKQYDDVIQQTHNILNYIALISYASNSFAHDPSASPDKATWIHDFSRLVGSIRPTSQEITSTLALLSAAVTNGNPLPPYLKAPQPYKLSAKLEALDPDILSSSHLAEPGYAAFAVMQIASSMLCDDLGKLIENVKALVGEVDFSFHVISTADSSEEELDKSKRD